MNKTSKLLPMIIPFLIACPVVATDREALVGTWKIVVFQDDGNDRLARLGAGPAKKGKPDRVARLVFTVDSCYLLRGDGRREMANGLTNAGWKRVVLDPDKTPKQIEVTGFAGKESECERTYRGIYEIEGGKLRISWAETGKARPTEFVSNGDFNLFECERVSDEPEPIPGG